MIKHKNVKIAYKIFFGLLGLSSIVLEIVTLINRGDFNLINFISYFTVLSNLFVAFVLLLSGYVLIKNSEPKWLDWLRGAATVYILIVGVGFAVLLSGLEGVAFTALPWNNFVLHYLMPVVLLFGYLVDRPATKLRFSRAIVWLAFPLVYVVYSLVRGLVTGWYPYPFLNLATSSADKVAIAVIGIFVLSIALTYGASRLSGTRK